jgi:hypothetical protein
LTNLLWYYGMHSMSKSQTTKFERTLSPKHVVNSPWITSYQSQPSPCPLNTKSHLTFNHTLASHFGLPPLAKGHETNTLTFAWSLLVLLATCMCSPPQHSSMLFVNPQHTHDCGEKKGRYWDRTQHFEDGGKTTLTTPTLNPRRFLNLTSSVCNNRLKTHTWLCTAKV